MNAQHFFRLTFLIVWSLVTTKRKQKKKQKKTCTYHENLRSLRYHISQHFRIHHGISRHNRQNSRDTQNFFNQSIRIRLIRIDDFLDGGLIAVAFRSRMVFVQGSAEFVLNILMARKEFESPYDCCGRCFVAFFFKGEKGRY